MFDNDGLAINTVAPTGGVVAGDFVYDPVTGFAGFALDTVDAGESVALEIARGHRVRLATALGAAVGDVLHVQDDGTLDDAADTGGARPFMKVTEVTALDATYSLVVGVVLPQTWPKFTVS